MTTSVHAQLAIPSIGFNQLFTGPTRADVDDQIEEFFKSQGSDVYSRFLAQMAKSAPLAVTDGNPNASTAVAAQNIFREQGFTPSEQLFAEDASSGTSLSGFGIGFNSGRYEAAGLSGVKSEVSVPFRFGISERLSFVGSIPLLYMTLEDAKVYGMGLNLALPYRIKIMTTENRWNWRVSPTVGLNAQASADLASGALLVQYGVVNSIDYRINSKWVFSIVNQLSGFQSLKIDYDGYSFDPNINQYIIKNGVRLTTRLSPRWTMDGYAVDTRFLKDAAVDQFFTFGTSASFKITKTGRITLGFNYDTGDNFKAWSAGLSSAWKF